MQKHALGTYKNYNISSYAHEFKEKNNNIIMCCSDKCKCRIAGSSY